MIVYTLACKHDHAFEAWFRDSAACDLQLEQSQVVCPTCGTTAVHKALMAPRLGKAGREEPPAPAAPAPVPAPGKTMVAQGDFVRALRELRQRVEANCEYVGPRFAEEARKIHKGEIDKRDIYGEASPDEARRLRDEGIEVHAIPWVPPHDA